MYPISGLSALYEILRRQLNTEAKQAGHAANDADEPAHAPAERVEFAELERQLRARLKEHARDSVLSPAAKRQVIASLLSWELDPRLQNEPKFNALVRNIQQSIDSDARLKAKFESAVDQLSR